MLPAMAERARLGASLRRGFLERPPEFTRELERRYQVDYYIRVQPGLRLVSLLLAGLMSMQSLLNVRTFNVPGAAQLVFWLCVLGLTWTPWFKRIWQPTLVFLSWATAVLVLRGPGHAFARDRLSGASHAGVNHIGHLGPTLLPPSVPQLEFMFMLQLTVLMVSLSVQRLSFRWTALLQGGVFVIALWFLRSLPDPDLGKFARFIVLPALIVYLVLLMAAFTQERLARSAFWSAYQLEEERDVERRQKEQTKGQLQVLARAIGGIVHDLGGPMTVMMMGADILAMQNNSADVQAIQEAVQMLSALRTSLIEQTRVLEGKLIRVDVEVESLREMIEAGVRFQNSRHMYGRAISLAGDEQQIYADRLKLVTVFMNLISNALKYSDGEVRIVWQSAGDFVLVAVLDHGAKGQGISEAQAQRLFVPFGRLESHADLEGTGLGLISAQKVVEAHGGAVYIEGHQDGSAASPPFTTATGPYRSTLTPGFLTGFVVALPTQHDGT